MISKHTTGVTDEGVNHRADNSLDCYFAFEIREKLPESNDYNRISVKTYYVEVAPKDEGEVKRQFLFSFAIATNAETQRSRVAKVFNAFCCCFLSFADSSLGRWRNTIHQIIRNDTKAVE